MRRVLGGQVFSVSVRVGLVLLFNETCYPNRQPDFYQ